MKFFFWTLSFCLSFNVWATKPQIATNDQGYSVVVWQKYNGSSNIIQAATRNKQGDWSAPQNLTSPFPGNIDDVGDVDPQVAVDPNGNVIVVWRNDDTDTIRGVVSQADGQWSDFFILSEPYNTISPPKIASKGVGKAIVVWSRREDGNQTIQASTILNAATLNEEWPSPVRLSLPGQNAINPQVAVDPQGNATIVWEKSDGLNTIIQASTQSGANSDNWSAPIDLGLTTKR